MIAKREKAPILPKSYRSIGLLWNLSTVVETVIPPWWTGWIPRGFASQFPPTPSYGGSTQCTWVVTLYWRGLPWHCICLKLCLAWRTAVKNPYLGPYLSGRSFRGKFDGELETSNLASLLAPELFIYHTSSTPHSPNTCLAIYAEITVIYTSSSGDGLICRRLQQSVEDVCEWTTRWRLSSNACKWKAICFSQKWNSHPIIIVVGQDERIPC